MQMRPQQCRYTPSMPLSGAGGPARLGLPCGTVRLRTTGKIETEAPQGTFRRPRVFVRCPFRTPHNSLSRLPPVFPHLSLPASAFSHRPTPLLFLSTRFLPCFRPCYARKDVQIVKKITRRSVDKPIRLRYTVFVLYFLKSARPGMGRLFCSKIINIAASERGINLRPALQIKHSIKR